MNIIDPERLKNRDVVTVKEWTRSNDTSYVGELLRVKHNRLPFIVLERRAGGLREDIKLDSRKVIFEKPIYNYAKEMLRDH